MKKKQFLSEANRLVGYHNDAYNPEERIRRALVRAYKKGVKDGQIRDPLKGVTTNGIERLDKLTKRDIMETK
jgi:hypothetical protein